MLTAVSITDFKAVPYLASTSLMSSTKGRLKFSTRLPNVIVGPNGTGKSALLDTLALRFLASQTGESSLDGKYLTGREQEALWSRNSEWSRDYRFMEGLEVDTDNGPALYYRPSHIPGNESDVTHAMMCGYHAEALAYHALIDGKSAGQQRHSLLEKMTAALRGGPLPSAYVQRNWSYGEAPRDVQAPSHGSWTGPWEYKAEVLKAMFSRVEAARPLILMDEPEQSLDARAELQLWQAITAADMGRMQVIVATHSIYPILHPNHFNIIEAAPGYVEEVRRLLG